MAERVAGLKWLLSAGGAAGAVLGIFLLASQSVQERFEEGAPTDSAVEVVEVGGECAEARRLFDYLSEFAAANRSCTTNDDCAPVFHPVGCQTVVSAVHAAEFESVRSRIHDLQAVSEVPCELPMARCKRTYVPVCLEGSCSICNRPWSPTNGI